MKKLSARRKNAFTGLRFEPSRTSASWSLECDERVANWNDCTRPPPSAFSLLATAIASTSVDLPLPFSPTKNETRGSSSSGVSTRLRIAGISSA